MNKDWYDDYLKEIGELESTLKCPNCGKIALVHSSYKGYPFICQHCQISFYYESGKYEKKFMEEEI